MGWLLLVYAIVILYGVGLACYLNSTREPNHKPHTTPSLTLAAVSDITRVCDIADRTKSPAVHAQVYTLRMLLGYCYVDTAIASGLYDKLLCYHFPILELTLDRLLIAEQKQSKNRQELESIAVCTFDVIARDIRTCILEAYK